MAISLERHHFVVANVEGIARLTAHTATVTGKTMVLDAGLETRFAAVLNIRRAPTEF